ncbi:MAG: hypothetical protein NTU53_23830 [Planctomycetota bacterium]|nr:hypothetical protein [Planctomycetota bacterium]
MKYTSALVLAAVAIASAQRPAVGDDRIYWIESRRHLHPNDSLWRAQLDGTDAREIVPELRISDSSTVWGMAVAGDTLYWTDRGPWVYSGGTVTPPRITVMQMKLDGSGAGPVNSLPPLVAAELLQGSAMDDQGYMYSYLSVVGEDGGAVGKIVRFGGGQLRDIATTAAFFPRPDIVLDLTARKIYWTGGWDMDNAGLIQRANLDGSELQTLVGPQNLDIADNGIELCLDIAGGKMYWNNSRNGMIQCANLDGTDIQPLISGIFPRAGLALDVSDGPLPEWALRVDPVSMLVPEPGGALTLTLTAACLLRRRRRAGKIERSLCHSAQLPNHS